MIALFHIQKPEHLEDEFTKFSVTSGHVSKGKGNGNHAGIANCICDVQERDQAIDWTRGRVARSLMVREHQSSLSRAQKCLGESCSRGAGGGGEGVLAHNRADPSLHARACVGSSTRGRCCGTRHDRYTFETDGGGAARKDEG